MVTEESLKEKYAGLTDEDLVDIVARKDDYTELAFAVARQELKKRKVPEATVKEHQLIVDNETNELEDANGLVDLELWRKIALYFLWVPKIRRYFTDGIVDGGYILRSNQATYYSVLGAIFFFVSNAVLFLSGSFLILWIGGFFLSYLFDIGYNKTSLTEKINKILVQKPRPFGYY